LEAFRLAAKLGATGLESDVWVTADGAAVLDHDGVLGGVLRRRRIAGAQRSQLPPHIPTLEELYAEIPHLELSLDVKDPAAFEPVVAVARAAGGGALERLWLCHDRLEVLAGWRDRAEGAHLVHSTFLRDMPGGPERHAARLADAGVEVVNLHHSEWTGGLAALFHRFERLAFGWDAQQERVLRELLDLGIDGIYSDHVDRMTDALARLGKP
jgi:glycerophosphoryl diester phosphodiesterase